MNRLAIIKDNIVQNVVAIDQETKQSTIDFFMQQGMDYCIETDLAGPGDSYIDGEFIRPEPTPESKKTLFTKLEMMSKFTNTELAAIYTAAKENVMVEVWLDMFKIASEIDTTDQRTIDGLNMLEAAGILQPGRANEILNN